MASLTQKKKIKEKRQIRTSGKSRKRALAPGTTPRFPVHVEKEPDCALPKPPGSHPDEQ